MILLLLLVLPLPCRQQLLLLPSQVLHRLLLLLLLQLLPVGLAWSLCPVRILAWGWGKGQGCGTMRASVRSHATWTVGMFLPGLRANMNI